MVVVVIKYLVLTWSHRGIYWGHDVIRHYFIAHIMLLLLPHPRLGHLYFRRFRYRIRLVDPNRCRQSEFHQFQFPTAQHAIFISMALTIASVIRSAWNIFLHQPAFASTDNGKPYLITICGMELWRSFSWSWVPPLNKLSSSCSCRAWCPRGGAERQLSNKQGNSRKKRTLMIWHSIFNVQKQHFISVHLSPFKCAFTQILLFILQAMLYCVRKGDVRPRRANNGIVSWWPGQANEPAVKIDA